MIEKITDFESLSGVLSPLLPLVYTDGIFSQQDIDGAFLQKTEDDVIQAVFSLKNTCVTLIQISDNGTDELEGFFSFCGVTEILSDKPVTVFCKKQKELNLLEYCGGFEESNGTNLTAKSTINDYSKVYKVVFAEGNNFENWFPEFSKKINSHNAFATYSEIDDNVISVAISPAIYGNAAVIAGVHTLKEYRNKGFASACIKDLLSKLKNRGITKIYLWCEDTNVDFYKQLYFRNIGKIYIGECK